ncbi:MAG: TIGR02584 family CRISPR-associated protein [Syntrophobacterales bacterium]|nr:TIGR02584 family CRISPR-associated protein [Syntrophobacterales bacterium]
MKNILLAGVGLSPQVVTETLYALHQQGKRVDAIHLITTRAGKAAVAASLLSPADGRNYAYFDDYGIDRGAIKFGFENIHVVKDARGNEIGDIEDEDDNEALLKMCFELTFFFTSEPETAVFFSIAGGRKTMSACLMVAAQLYGRPQDRIYHVLVFPEFEGSGVFFYPPRRSHLIQLIDNNNQPFFKETRWAKVTLLPLPFVSVRERISDELLRTPKKPAELMQSLIGDEPPLLMIDIPAGKVVYQRREFDMMPARLALYAFFVLLKKDCLRLAPSALPRTVDAIFPEEETREAQKAETRIADSPIQHGRRADKQDASVIRSEDTAPYHAAPPLASPGCRDCRDCWIGFYDLADRQEIITELYRLATGGCTVSEMSDTGITNLNAENFNSYRVKINRDLERGFGAPNAARIMIAATGTRPHTRYGIELDREYIRVVL